MPGTTPFVFLALGGAISVAISHNILQHTIYAQTGNFGINTTISVTDITNVTAATNWTLGNLTQTELNNIKIFSEGIQWSFILPVAGAGLFLVACLLVGNSIPQ
jgi:hypothetical protein